MAAEGEIRLAWRLPRETRLRRVEVIDGNLSFCRNPDGGFVVNSVMPQHDLFLIDFEWCGDLRPWLKSMCRGPFGEERTDTVLFAQDGSMWRVSGAFYQGIETVPLPSPQDLRVVQVPIIGAATLDFTSPAHVSEVGRPRQLPPGPVLLAEWEALQGIHNRTAQLANKYGVQPAAVRKQLAKAREKRSKSDK